MLTAFEQLQRDLEQAEEWMTRLKTATADQVIQVIVGLDGAQDLVDSLLESDARTPAEEIQRIETIESFLRKQMAAAVRTLEAADVSLAQVAAERAKLPDAWWWRLPELLREHRQQTIRGWLIRVGILLAVLAVGFVLYRTVFAPDPLVVARMDAVRNAQTALMEGELDVALNALDAGLELVPGDMELLTWRGVILTLLEQPQAAADAFAVAEAQGRWDMLAIRAQAYLYANLPAAALNDAQDMIELTPDNPVGYLLLGDAHQISGNGFEADQAYAKTEELAFGDDDYASLYVLARQRRAALQQQMLMPDMDADITQEP